MWDELCDLRFDVDDADHHRRVARKLPRARAVNPRAASVALDAPINNRVGHSQLLALRKDRFVQRLALPLVGLAEIDAQHPSFELFFHCPISITVRSIPSPAQPRARSTS